MTRLACTLPGARPAVGPVKAPARMRRRSRSPALPPIPVIAFIDRTNKDQPNQ